MNKEEGKELLELARISITSNFDKKGIATDKFKEQKGVFVTIYTNNELRGCIGFIYPNTSLGLQIIQAARLAAFHDPRFPPLKKDEKFKLEISVLTKPELIKENTETRILNSITIGKDGLIISQDYSSGLLLPQVALEHKMSKKEFLEAVCEKADLPKDTWKLGKCKLYKFQAEIFKE